MSKRDGGAAFPSMHEMGEEYPRLGMTLRDWFAGQALAGLLASQVAIDGRNSFSGESTQVNAAYRFADAMLAERAKAGEGEG